MLIQALGRHVALKTFAQPPRAHKHTRTTERTQWDRYTRISANRQNRQVFAREDVGAHVKNARSKTNVKACYARHAIMTI
jgi:hypothetical protein